MNSQTRQIIDHLQDGNSLSPIEALNMFGCFRLSARIHDIKQLGFDVKTDIVLAGGKRYAKYSFLMLKNFKL